MVLYLNESILNESVSGDDVSSAIDNRVGVLITYNGENNEHSGVRYIEPYVYGATTKNNPAIRAYQYYGDTKTGVPEWKLFRLDRIQSWQPTGNKFDIEPQARGWAAQAFNGQDKLLPTIYKVVDLNENPTTDLEKMQARTRQLQQSQPININQIQQQQQTTSPVKQEPKVNGPLGNNNPKTGEEKPEDIGSYPQKTQPIDNNTQVISQGNQNNKVIGPISGNEKNTQKNNPNELMSNDQFRDMLKRNLGITQKEKNKRGVDMNGNPLKIGK